VADTQQTGYMTSKKCKGRQNTEEMTLLYFYSLVT